MLRACIRQDVIANYSGTLRVAYPIESATHAMNYTTSYAAAMDPQNNSSWVLLRQSIAFFEEVKKKYLGNPTIIHVNLSWAHDFPASLITESATFWGGYTKCVHAVSIGHADVCVGDLWQSSMRSTLAAAVEPMATDDIRLLLKREPAAEVEHDPSINPSPNSKWRHRTTRGRQRYPSHSRRLNGACGVPSSASQL